MLELERELAALRREKSASPSTMGGGSMKTSTSARPKDRGNDSKRDVREKDRPSSKLASSSDRPRERDSGSSSTKFGMTKRPTAGDTTAKKSWPKVSVAKNSSSTTSRPKEVDKAEQVIFI